MRRDDADTTRSYFRSETRLFNLNGSWYFATREGDQGPFASRDLAHAEALRYANERQSLCGFQEAREAERKAKHVAGQRRFIVPMEKIVPRHEVLSVEPD